MIAWLRRLSWKWKLTILFVFGFLFLIGFTLSETGHDWAYNYIKRAYNEMPEAERRDSKYADWYLKLAFFCGNIRGDEKKAMFMYKEFLGILEDEKGINFFDEHSKKKLHGLCSEDGKTGWGPAHPLAADAYYAYIEFNEIHFSAQNTQLRCIEYYELLYDWMIKKGPDHKPHPKFKKYWDKVLFIAKKHPQPLPPNIKQGAPEAPAVGPDD
jgi:hypothetical protein